MIIKILFRKKKAIVSSVFAFILCACTSQAHEKEAALLPANSEQARAEIIKLISQSLGGKHIPIAEDVFQHSSRLLLGKTAVTSPEGIKVLRADKEVTIVFDLVKQDDNCLLRRINSSQEWPLKTKKCFKRE